MTEIEVARQIISNNGECDTLDCFCADCPANKGTHFEGEYAVDAPCSRRFGISRGLSIGSPVYMEHKRAWFKYWLQAQGGNMDNTAMEKITAMEKELEILKARMNASEQAFKQDLVFNPRKSYVGVDNEGYPYYLVGSGADYTAESSTVYSWHDLRYNMALTWDGIHESGQDALDSVMNDKDFDPWTIHEFTSGQDAIEFYVSLATE